MYVDAQDAQDDQDALDHPWMFSAITNPTLLLLVKFITMFLVSIGKPHNSIQFI